MRDNVEKKDYLVGLLIQIAGRARTDPLFCDEAIDSAVTLLGRPSERADIFSGFSGFSLHGATESVEKVLVSRALKFARGNRKEAAGLLEISLRSLYYKIKRYDLRNNGTPTH